MPHHLRHPGGTGTEHEHRIAAGVGRGETALDELAARYPARLTVLRHRDDEHGYVDAAKVLGFVGPHTAGDAYICGLEPFMELVENALPGPGRIFSERFGSAPAEPAPAATEEGTVTIFLNRKKKSVPRRDGETLLESARRAGLAPPFSCESGNCATCMAELTAVKATMRVNDALTDDDLDEGYILTCQAVPDTPSVTVRYE